MGFFSAITILTAPTMVSTGEYGGDVTLAARNPASDSVSVDKGRIQVVKLTCDEEMKLSQEAHQIRLKGHVCSDMPLSIEKSTVKNSENEEVATVFHKEKDFTTDVIHLRPGQNRLVITNVLSDGSTKTQVLRVQRAPSSIQQ